MSATHTLCFRLVAAFSTVVVAFDAAVVFVFLSVARIHEATHDEKHVEEVRDVLFGKSEAGKWTTPQAVRVDGWKRPG